MLIDFWSQQIVVLAPRLSLISVLNSGQ